MTLLISEKGWTKHQLLNCIDDFTVQDLQHFIPKLLTQNLFIESLMYGNLTQEVNNKRKILTLFLHFINKILKLKKALEYLKTVEHKLKSTDLIKCDQLRPLQSIYLNNFRQFNLPNGCNSVFLKENKVHKTNAIEVYFQCGIKNSFLNVYFFLIYFFIFLFLILSF